MFRITGSLGVLGLFFVGSLALPASGITIGFETEDDGVTPLITGQIVDDRVDPGNKEFGKYFTLTSENSDSHLGLTIFDSDQPSGFDADLAINAGNILIVQDPDVSGRTTGSSGAVFDTPNDAGTYINEDSFRIRFDFLQPVELLSITVIDIDTVALQVTLLDSNAFARTYDVPEGWTTDRNNSPGTDGFKVLDLTTLLPQTPEAGASGTTPATATQDPLFDEEDVRFLFIDYVGSGPSAGFDNLEFNLIPEPGTAALLLLGSSLIVCRQRRRR
jgi:hypothetical protein